MRTTYRIVPEGGMQAYEISEAKEQIEAVNAAMDYIIGVSGDFTASLEFLREHGIDHRLDWETVSRDGMGILADLRQLRLELECNLCEMER